MKPPFFPNPAFGWFFFCALMLLLCIAAYLDLRTARIPKAITFSIVITGLLANIVRGYLMGCESRETWELGAGSPYLGMLDGLLFSLCGLFSAFFLYMLMFALRAVRGGDVKLCTGIGAWIGALNIVFFLLASVVTLLLWMVGVIMVGLSEKASPGSAKKAKSGSLLKTKMTFSLAAAVAAAIVMLLAFRYDLQLWEPPEKEMNHALVAPANG